ncbi:MAG: hypothetical protein MJB57_06120 [Gemmatimonadetes bacterium]|nr:hypothetical protein [Gemmatimonadota bacterium]
MDRRAGDREDELRITVRLSDGSDGTEIWSDRYDRTAGDIFRVQDEIAAAVVNELRVTLLGDALDRETPASTAAHDLFLQGRYFAERRTEIDMRRAVELLTQTIEQDPDFAPAWGRRAVTYGNLALIGSIDGDSARALQSADVARARALAPNDPLDLYRPHRG